MKAYHGHEFLLMASNNLSQDKLDDYMKTVPGCKKLQRDDKIVDKCVKESKYGSYFDSGTTNAADQLESYAEKFKELCETRFENSGKSILDA